MSKMEKLKEKLKESYGKVEEKTGGLRGLLVASGISVLTEGAIGCASVPKNSVINPVPIKTELKLYEGNVEEGTSLSSIMYANGLISKGVSTSNPLLMGGGALIYFAMANAHYMSDTKPAERLRLYASAVMEQAILLAKSQGQYKAMAVLAAIYADQDLGAGKGFNYIEEANKLVREKGEGKPCSMILTDTSNTPIEEKEIVALQAAYGLMAEALSDVDHINPIKLALAGALFYMMVPEENSGYARFGRSLLEQATLAALHRNDICAISYCAAVWHVIFKYDAVVRYISTKVDPNKPTPVQTGNLNLLIPREYYIEK
ncbi:MAG: hypothetical protein QXL47_00705 [Candidatus Anstonellales archaeon]